MMDRAAAYKTSQILTASPVERVVLLYRGAIRFATLQVAETERGHREAAHNASIRAQEIVSALRETLDLSAGAVARQLDGLYDFCLRRLTEGNIRSQAAPVREAIQVLQGLLEAWLQVANLPGATAQAARLPSAAPTSTVASPYRVSPVGALSGSLR
jgi:flagellar secretion chaperone FliS